MFHFVGFKDDRYWAAVKAFGKPDFVHRFWETSSLNFSRAYFSQSSRYSAASRTMTRLTAFAARAIRPTGATAGGPPRLTLRYG